jgi:putative SOS response-associated peptidase YedK
VAWTVTATFRQRRFPYPANGFYEWKRRRAEQPYYVYLGAPCSPAGY